MVAERHRHRSAKPIYTSSNLVHDSSPPDCRKALVGHRRVGRVRLNAVALKATILKGIRGSNPLLSAGQPCVRLLA